MHPQNKDACPHMRNVITLETMDDIDTDKDGYVSAKEFEVLRRQYTLSVDRDPESPGRRFLRNPLIDPFVESESQSIVLFGASWAVCEFC